MVVTAIRAPLAVAQGTSGTGLTPQGAGGGGGAGDGEETGAMPGRWERPPVCPAGPGGSARPDRGGGYSALGRSRVVQMRPSRLPISPMMASAAPGSLVMPVAALTMFCRCFQSV